MCKVESFPALYKHCGTGFMKAWKKKTKMLACSPFDKVLWNSSY